MFRPAKLQQLGLEVSQQYRKLGEPSTAEGLIEERLDLRENLSTRVHLCPASFRETHQRRSSITRVGPALDVAVLLEVVHEVPDRLIGELTPFRQLADPRSFRPQVLEDRQVGDTHVVKPNLAQSFVYISDHQLKKVSEVFSQGNEAYVDFGVRIGSCHLQSILP